MSKRWLSYTRAASLLGMEQGTIGRLVRDGELRQRQRSVVSPNGVAYERRQILEEDLADFAQKHGIAVPELGIAGQVVRRPRACKCGCGQVARTVWASQKCRNTYERRVTQVACSGCKQPHDARSKQCKNCRNQNARRRAEAEQQASLERFNAEHGFIVDALTVKRWQAEVKAGWKCTEIARRVGLTRHAVANYVNGKTPPMSGAPRIRKPEPALPAVSTTLPCDGCRHWRPNRSDRTVMECAPGWALVCKPMGAAGPQRWEARGEVG